MLREHYQISLSTFKDHIVTQSCLKTPQTQSEAQDECMLILTKQPELEDNTWTDWESCSIEEMQ